MSRRVRADRVVTLSYELRDDQGNALESRTPENPAMYIQGRGQLLTAVERALEGQTPGFTTVVRLDPRDAYGAYRPDLVTEVPRSMFPQAREIEPGMKFDTVGPDGQPLVVRVVEATEETVTLDGNHPLAGVALVFELKILDVREPTDEEREVGLVVPSDRSSMH